MDMKAVIYARVSSREQQEGNSLEAQVKLCRQYAGKHDFEIVKEFKVAESANYSDRKAFEEMIIFLKTNDVGNIICEKVDRLLRGDLKDRVALDDLVNDLQKEIHFVKENFILNKESKSSQKLYYGIQAEFARFYLNNLSDEVRKAYEVMVEEGHYPHPPPTGYKIKLENHLAVIDPEKAPYIIKAFEMAAKGTESLDRIGETLYNEGFRSRNGKRITLSELARILHNPFYYGDFNWRGEVKVGKHPPLISRVLFEKVQLALSPRGRNKGIVHRFTYAGGLLTCGHCGNGITGETHKGHIYYHCTKPKGAKSCSGLFVREEVIEEQLREIIKAITLDKRVVDLIKRLLRESHEEEEEYHARSLNALQARYEVIKGRLDKLLDVYIEGGINKSTYADKSKELELEKETINSEIVKHKNADKAYFEQIENFVEVAHRASDLFASSKPELKRELLKFVVSNLSLNGKKVVATYRTPFNLLVEYGKNENWQGHVESNHDQRFWRPLFYH